MRDGESGQTSWAIITSSGYEAGLLATPWSPCLMNSFPPSLTHSAPSHQSCLAVGTSPALRSLSTSCYRLQLGQGRLGMYICASVCTLLPWCLPQGKADTRGDPVVGQRVWEVREVLGAADITADAHVSAGEASGATGGPSLQLTYVFSLTDHHITSTHTHTHTRACDTNSRVRLSGDVTARRTRDSLLPPTPVQHTHTSRGG